MARKPKILDSSLIKNDVLRPWTIDIHENEKLFIETSALDIVLTYTTPQKFAGTLGISPLDARPKGYQEFEHTLNDKIVRTLRTTKINNHNNIKNRNGGNFLNLPLLSPTRNEGGILQQTTSSNRSKTTFPSNRDKNMNDNPATNSPPITNNRSNVSKVDTNRLKLTLNNDDNYSMSSYYSLSDSSSSNKNNNNNSNNLNSNASSAAIPTASNTSLNTYIDKIYDDHDLEHIDRLRTLLFLKTSKSKYRMNKIKSMNSLEEIKYIGSPEKAVKSPYSSKLKLLPVLTNKMKNRIRPKTNA